MTILRAISFGLLGLMVVAGISGCGGDGASRQSGTVGYAVVFPPRDASAQRPASTTMPGVTNSVLIHVRATGEGAGAWERRKIINRPENAETVRGRFEDVPVGEVLITVTCFDGYDASGNRVAEASSVASILPDQVTSVEIVTDRLAERIGIHAVPMPDGDPPATLSSVRLEPGEETRVQARAWDFDGTETVYVDLAWTLNSPADGLTVDPLTGSIVTLEAFEDGEHQLTVTDAKSGRSATLDITVASRPVVFVDLNPLRATLYRFSEPDSVQLVASALDGAEEEIPYAQVSYQSTDSEVAVVDEIGLVTAAGPGTCDIIVTGASATGSASAICRVTVIDTGELDVIIQ